MGLRVTVCSVSCLFSLVSSVMCNVATHLYICAREIFYGGYVLHVLLLTDQTNCFMAVGDYDCSLGFKNDLKAGSLPSSVPQ